MLYIEYFISNFSVKDSHEQTGVIWQFQILPLSHLTYHLSELVIHIIWDCGCYTKTIY